jgi:hypothetical protein
MSPFSFQLPSVKLREIAHLSRPFRMTRRTDSMLQRNEKGRAAKPRALSKRNA